MSGGSYTPRQGIRAASGACPGGAAVNHVPRAPDRSGRPCMQRGTPDRADARYHAGVCRPGLRRRRLFYGRYPREGCRAGGEGFTSVSIHCEENRGLGAAIVIGYTAAPGGGMDIVAVMAGGNQMDPALLSKLLDPIVDGKTDYTIGNHLINPEFRGGMNRWRFVGNSALALLTRIASGYWRLVDPQNGYTAISRRALETILLDAAYPRYSHCNDIIVRLNVYGFRDECPASCAVWA